MAERKEIITGSATFEGDTKNGLKHGWLFGTLRWDDGDVFEGYFENDEKVKGTFRWKGGDTYTGEWKGHLMHGQGTYTYKDGRVYNGQWDYGYKQGKGTFSWPNGDRYEGEFHKDMIQGYGTYTFADGRVYKGEWQQDRKHGYGILTWPTGEKTEGMWEGNLMNGPAIFTQSDGKRFEEKWALGAREGKREPLSRKSAEIMSTLDSTDPPAWVPDKDQKECTKCRLAFSVINRRHHCRHCGAIFCSNCSSKKLPVPRLRFAEPVRVCDECFLLLKCHRADGSTEAKTS